MGATTVAGNLIGLNVATPRIGTAMAAIFIATIPLFSMLIGLLWRIEHVDRFGRIGVALGFLGVVLLVGFPAVPVTSAFVVGCVVSLAGAVSAAFGSNYARKHLQQVGSWEQTIGAFLVGGLLVAPLLVVVPVPAAPTALDVGYLVALAAFCSALAYVLYFRLVAEVGATVAVSVEFLVTVIAVVVGATFLGERLSLVQVLGGAVIIVGCSLVLGLLPCAATARSGRSPARSRRSEPPSGSAPSRHDEMLGPVPSASRSASSTASSASGGRPCAFIARVRCVR